MSWEVEYTDEFEEWWNTLSEGEQESINASIQLLEALGPTLRRFPAKNIPNLLVFLSIFCVVKILI